MPTASAVEASGNTITNTAASLLEVARAILRHAAWALDHPGECTDRGVFDRTHLRWFTPTTFAQMFEDAGFRIAWMGPVTPFSQRTRLLSRLTGGRFDHLFVTQIAIAGVRR